MSNNKKCGIVLSMDQSSPKSYAELEKYYKQALAQVQELRQEIREHSRTEEALRESEEKYRTLIEQSDDAIFLLYKGRFEVINPKFKTLFGVTREQTNSLDFVFANIIAPKSKAIIEQLTDKQLTRQTIDPISHPYYELTAINKDDEDIEIELSVSYPIYRGGLAIQGIIRDITERKRIEEETQRAYQKIQQYSVELAQKIEEEKRQREVATILAEVVAAVNLTLSTDELLNHILRKLGQLVPYDSGAVFLVKENYLVIEAAQGLKLNVINQKYEQNKLYKEMQAQKSCILIPDTFQDPRYQFWQGAKRVKSWIGAPLMVAQKTIGYLAVDRHTSGAFTPYDADLVQALAHQVAQTIYNAQLFTELNEAQAQLIQGERLAALGQMSATVAHELRNPLMAIKMGVEYLVHDLPEDDPHQKGAVLMQANMNRVDRIVEDILFFARSPEPNLALGSLHSILEQEIKRWQFDFTGKRTTCHVDLATNLPATLIDSDQIGRAISNLIGNSIDAMGPDGELKLTLHSDDGRQIITLIDNGLGIPPEHQQKIFEPFYTTKSRGTGLGLAIIKQIIDTHHGEIKVWSKANVGTKFTIILPYSTDLKDEEK